MSGYARALFGKYLKVIDSRELKSKYAQMPNMQGESAVSCTDIDLPLFNQKQKAIMEYVFTELRSKRHNVEMLKMKMTTPQKKIKGTNRAGYKIINDNVNVVKVSRNVLSNDSVNIHESPNLYVIPYINNMRKTDCKLNLFVTDNLDGYTAYQKNAGYYNEGIGGKCIVNVFQYESYSHSETMDDDYKLNVGKIINIISDYDEFVDETAKETLKDNKKLQFLAKTICSSARKRLIKSGFIERDSSSYYGQLESVTCENGRQTVVVIFKEDSVLIQSNFSGHYNMSNSWTINVENISPKRFNETFDLMMNVFINQKAILDLGSIR